MDGGKVIAYWNPFAAAFAKHAGHVTTDNGFIWFATAACGSSSSGLLTATPQKAVGLLMFGKNRWTKPSSSKHDG
jgi:hypothetical protein